MVLQQWLNNPEFLEKDQFEKRKILKRSILSDKYCVIGKTYICFDNENYCSDRKYYNPSSHCNLTIGKSYEILDHKIGKIKILNDQNRKFWSTINRFMYSVKYERRDKLKNISRSGDDILNDIEEKKLICVLCGQEWGIENKYTNTCENIECNGFCTWGYSPMKPESFTIDDKGFWHLIPIPKDLNELYNHKNK